MTAYTRRVTRPKPRQSQLHKWVAPVAGWISNRALAEPASMDGPGAAVLDNFFPRSTGVSLRRGKQRYATLEDINTPVLSLFAYRNGLDRHLFAANSTKIYDITNVPFPDEAEIVTEDDDLIVTDTGDWFGWSSTSGLDVVTGMTGGNWITVQFATVGGVFLIGVNGEDTGFIYDGSDFLEYDDDGVSRLGYDGMTTGFTVGDTVTGGTSGASGVILKIVESTPTSGYLLLDSVTGGPFQDNEAITDGGGGAALANGADVQLTPGITFGSSGLSTADMSFVWVYKERLWFIQKDSLSAWYLPVDSIGGAAEEFPLGGVLNDGGSLLFGQKWAMDTSGEGGLSEQIIFVSTLGEVPVFQGANPGAGGDFLKVGVYRIGTPLGNKAFLRGGGDLAIATSVGLVPLSKAIKLDITALNVATVSHKIADAWTGATTSRGLENWQAFLWAEGKMALIAPPDLIGSSFPVIFVSNTETGAWCRFTGWHAFCFEVFEGVLYFGSSNGRVYTANVSGVDDGAPYTGTIIPLFEDMGSPASAKIGTVGRARTRSNYATTAQITMVTDYNMVPPAPPDAGSVAVGSVWGTGIWGTSTWGEIAPNVINQPWSSVGGIGYALAPCYQVTSGTLAPLDDEVIDMELLFDTAEVVT